MDLKGKCRDPDRRFSVHGRPLAEVDKKSTIPSFYSLPSPLRHDHNSSSPFDRWSYSGHPQGRFVGCGAFGDRVLLLWDILKLLPAR